MPKLSYFEVQARIAALKRSNMKTMDMELLLSRLTPLFRGYSLRTPILHSGTMLYRAVKWSVRPSLKTEISYPPVERCTTFQRANAPGEPMFYCSVGWPAPVFELQMKPGERLALSKWRVSENLFINNVGFTKRTLDAIGSGRDGTPWFVDEVSVGKASLLVTDYLASEFSRSVEAGQEHVYKLSAAISRKLIGKKIVVDRNRFPDAPVQGKISGLIYPAMAMRGIADNIVLTPECVERSLAFETVEYIEIDEIEVGEGFRYSEIDFANSITSEGVIDWKGRPAQWTLKPGEAGRVELVDGRWKMFDVYGSEVPQS